MSLAILRPLYDYQRVQLINVPLSEMKMKMKACKLAVPQAMLIMFNAEEQTPCYTGYKCSSKLPICREREIT